MTINLLSEEDYKKLLHIQKTYPYLTFQNEGFEYIDKTVFTEEEKAAFATVTEILSRCVVGFSKFFNFKVRKNGNIVVRFDYDWTADDRSQGASFIGVGYVTVEELHKGFNAST